MRAGSVCVCVSSWGLYNPVSVLMCVWNGHYCTAADKRQETLVCLQCVIRLFLWMRVKSIKSKWKSSLSLSYFLFHLIVSLSLTLSQPPSLSLSLDQINLPPTDYVITERRPGHACLSRPAWHLVLFAHASLCVHMSPQKHDSSLRAALMNKDDINP